MEAFEKQIVADRYQGYDYVGYHAYAKRRYYELVQRKFTFLHFISPCVTRSQISADFDALCTNVKAFNTTCSWKGFEDRSDKSRTEESWFHGCACQMIVS